MNILFLYGGEIRSTRGGVQRVTENLADEFERRGHKVFYLSKNKEPDAHEISPRQHFLPANDWCAPENRAFLLIFLKENAIDVVINQGGISPECSRFSYIAKGAGVPVIGECHTSILAVPLRFCAIKENAWKKRKMAWLLPVADTRLGKKFLLALYKRKYGAHFRELCRKSDKVVMLSERYKLELAFYFGTETAPENVGGVPNPVPTSSQAVDFSAKKRELLFVGKMENGIKRVDLLLQIWAKLEARFPAWSLRLVGGGFDIEEIRALAKTLGLRRVFFEGFQKPEKFYRDASIFCMMSAFEGFPMALVEAAAFACVPVAFDSFAAVHDIISDGKNGALVPAFDLEKYAETLARLMSDDAERERLARAAQRDVARFSVEKIADRWEQIFNEVCGSSK